MPPYMSGKVGWITTPGITCPTLYEEWVGFLTSYRFITCARACKSGPNNNNIIIMEFIWRLYIAVLSALQCKKGHKNIINHKFTYNTTEHIGKFIAYTS